MRIKVDCERIRRNTEAVVKVCAAHGIEVAWDQYPYTAWGSGLIDYLPHWVAADGREKLVERLRDETTRQIIREEIERDVRNGQHPLCAAPWWNRRTTCP